MMLKIYKILQALEGNPLNDNFQDFRSLNWTYEREKVGLGIKEAF